jgi:hypothetical protein
LGSLGLGNIDIGDFGGDFTFDDSSFAAYVDPRVGDFSGTNDNTTAGTGGGDFAIPQRTAIRSVVPGTYDPNRRAGSGGQRYFSDMQYVPNVADPAAQRAANLAAQGQTNAQAMMLAYQNALNPAYQTRPGTATDRATSIVQRAMGLAGLLPTAQVGAGLTPTARTTGQTTNGTITEGANYTFPTEIQRGVGMIGVGNSLEQVGYRNPKDYFEMGLTPEDIVSRGLGGFTSEQPGSKPYDLLVGEYKNYLDIQEDHRQGDEYSRRIMQEPGEYNFNVTNDANYFRPAITFGLFDQGLTPEQLMQPGGTFEYIYPGSAGESGLRQAYEYWQQNRAGTTGGTTSGTTGENFPEIIGGGVVSNTVGDGFGEIVGGTTGGTTGGTGTTTTDTSGADTDTEYNNFVQPFIGRQLNAEDAAALAASGYSLNRLAKTFKADPENLRSFINQQTGGTATLDDGTTGRAGMANLLEELGGTKNSDGTVTDSFGTTLSWQDGAFRPISELDAFARNFAGKTLTLEDLTSIGASGYDTAALASALKVDPDKLSGAVTSATQLQNLASGFTGTIDPTYAKALVDSGFSADTLAEALNIPGFTGEMLADVVNAQLNNQTTTTTTTTAGAGTDIVDTLTGTTDTTTAGAGTDIVDTLTSTTDTAGAGTDIVDTLTGTTDTAGAGTDIVDTLTGTTDTADTTTSSLELFAQNNAGKTLTSEDLVALNNLAGEGYSAQDVIDTLGLKDKDGNPISETQLNKTLDRAVGTNTLNTIAADTDGLDENQVRDIAGLITSNTLGIGEVADTFGVGGMDVVAELFNAGYETGEQLTDRLGAFNEGLTEVDLVANLLNTGKTDVNTVAKKYNTTPEAVQAELDKVNEQNTLDYLAGLSDAEVGALINDDKLSIGQAVRVYQDRYPGLTEADIKASMKAMGYAQGGNVSGYYLGGPTDGMADQIPATINDMQPARLSHGEFVVPADVVSHLGNGNSDAGAKELESMMDRVRKARTGTTKQGKQINPNKFLV